MPRNSYSLGYNENDILMKELLVLLVLILAISYFSYQSSLFGDIDKVHNKYKAKIGTEFIIEQDTLLILDYSFWHETFTLSDGRVISSTLVFTQK